MFKSNKPFIKVGIVGVSGYSGGELAVLLLKHPLTRLTYVSANNTTGKLSEIWPQLKGQTKLVCKKYDPRKAINSCECVFLAVPHTLAMQIAPQLLKAGLRVIDISADYRFKDSKLFQKLYGKAHKDKKSLEKSVYGLPELYRQDIKKAQLIANPGCYPTAAILGLAPIAATKARSIESITIDAKSGTSGAGRKTAVKLLFSEISENIRAYKVLRHQHAPEVEAYLSQLSGMSIPIDFVPHIIPVHRGILATIYVRFKNGTLMNKIPELYHKFYKTEDFVRVYANQCQPEIKNVVKTNYCDIGLSINQNHRLAVITVAIDNLLKGASGQALQNMNIMYGFDESAGLS